MPSVTEPLQVARPIADGLPIGSQKFNVTKDFQRATTLGVYEFDLIGEVRVDEIIVKHVNHR